MVSMRNNNKYRHQVTYMNKRNFGSSPPDFEVNKDYYKIMGVPPSANEKDIKTAYYKLA